MGGKYREGTNDPYFKSSCIRHVLLAVWITLSRVQQENAKLDLGPADLQRANAWWSMAHLGVQIAKVMAAQQDGPGNRPLVFHTQPSRQSPRSLPFLMKVVDPLAQRMPFLQAQAQAAEEETGQTYSEEEWNLIMGVLGSDSINTQFSGVGFFILIGRLMMVKAIDFILEGSIKKQLKIPGGGRPPKSIFNFGIFMKALDVPLYDNITLRHFLPHAHLSVVYKGFRHSFCMHQFPSEGIYGQGRQGDKLSNKNLAIKHMYESYGCDNPEWRNLLHLFWTNGRLTEDERSPLSSLELYPDCPAKTVQIDSLIVSRGRSYGSLKDATDQVANTGCITKKYVTALYTLRAQKLDMCLEIARCPNPDEKASLESELAAFTKSHSFQYQ